MALLEVDNLEVTVSVGGVSAKAVERIGFTVDDGEVLGIVGESGCGKSITALTVMRLLPTSCRITAGSIRFSGIDLVSLPASEMRRLRGSQIAMIFQEPLSALNPVFSVGDQIGETLRIHERLDRRTARRRVLELLDVVGISDPERRIDQYPHELSGGMRQRVMIAMALACRPRLLIADEPTTALDVTIQAQILALIRRLQRELRMATIFITHDLGVIAQFADRVAVMYAGRIVEQAPVERIFETPRHPYTRALLESIPSIARDVRRLTVIPGTVPPLTEFPSGCRFAPRCSYARDECATMPEDFLAWPGKAHSVACIRMDELEPA
ncbi:MAG: ABC transporter ATP-binding protein [Bradyrhizobiaceae bacterium]|nr:ABC transporter ATP-binding protein [Bradyrhizobiaceae bacterium]